MTLGLLAGTVLFFLVFVTGVMLYPYIYYTKLDKELQQKKAPAKTTKKATAKK